MLSKWAQNTALFVIAFVLFTACNESATNSLTLYSGRKQNLVDPVIKKFEEKTGIKVKVSYKETGLLTNTLQEEGDKSPADLFWAQDANSLGVISKAELFDKLPDEIVNKAPQGFRDTNGYWVPTSGRARVIAYAPSRVKAEDVPKSVFDLTQPKWKGKIGWAPSNASFQAFLTAMILKHGKEKAKEWLEGMKKNEPKSYPKNTPIIEALAAGEIDLGIPNHYYLLRYKSKDNNYPVEQKFFQNKDVGNLVFVAGAGILKTSKNKEAAKKFIEFLLSADAQQYFTSEVFEYPMTEDAKPHEKLVPLKDLLEKAPDVSLEELNDLETTLKLLRDAGLL